MVKVHVWLQHQTNVGHASLTINNVYVSFWPDGTATKKDLKLKTSQRGQFLTALDEDIKQEGRPPVTVTLQNLDEVAMLNHVQELLRVVPEYQLAKHNCSHVIASCLVVGAGRQPSFTPHAGAYSRLGKVLGRGIWTPDQILRLAQELAK